MSARRDRRDEARYNGVVHTSDGGSLEPTRRAGNPLRHGAAVALAGVLGISVAVAATPAPPELRTVGDRVGVAAAAVGAVPAPTTTSTTSPPAEPQPEIPVPEALPLYAYEETPQIVLGTLEIPRLGVVAELQEGMTLTAINRGPSHWPGTALPGNPGNVVVAGHRTTYSRPFADLDLLVEGDQVIFRMKDGEVFTYEVRGVIIVPAEAIGIASQTWARTATLFACHPKGSATHRVVAKLRLLDEGGEPADNDVLLPPLDVGLRPQDYELIVRDPTGPAPLDDPYADDTAPPAEPSSGPSAGPAPEGSGGLPTELPTEASN